jgi:two-component system, NtrC family, sensor kinase
VWLEISALPLLAGALGLGWLRLRAGRQGVAAIVAASRKWAGGDFTARATLARPRHLARVAAALNQMATALERSNESYRQEIVQQVAQSEKLATTGRLAAGVAHELNNPVGSILLYGNLLVEVTPPDDPRRDNMEKIVTQAARAREIVRSLLDFSRQSPARIERVDLTIVIRQVLTLLERQPLMQRVQVRMELSAVPLPVEVDVGKIQQVLVNIVINALEAMRNGGTLTVRTGFSERPGFCRVAISDTGVGIDPRDLGRIFEPFFTTKEVGQALGLGLAISYGIVAQHGGDIDVQSTPGVGSTFRVLLPVEGEGRQA